MIVDFLLASAHHVLIFLLMGSLAGEAVLLAGILGKDTFGRLSRLDAIYGTSAGLVIAVGICRVIFGLKGWEYYVASHAFWTKMALFLAAGALSVAPTMRYARWRRQANADAGFVVSAQELASTRRAVSAQLGLLLLIPIVAAAMARNLG